MTTIWTHQHSQTNTEQSLPIAVAMLLPTSTPEQIKFKVQAILATIPLTNSIWLGETSGPITDFALARNQLLNQVKEPWILWLDSDETLDVSNFDWQKLRIELQDEATMGFYLQRHDSFHQARLKFGEAGSMSLLRLHRTNAGEFINQVHEVFQPQAATQVKNLPIKIYHHSHASISQFLTKISHYAKIRARERLNQKPQPTKSQLIWELIWWPIGKFGLNYILKSGYRDGWRGLTYAVMMSVHSSLVRIFALEQLFPVNHDENK